MNGTGRVFSILFGSDWLHVCHRVQSLLHELCASRCLGVVPVSVGETECFKGRCICLRHGSPPDSNTTLVRARVWLDGEIPNATWPPWVLSVVGDEEQPHTMWPLAAAAFSAAAALAVLLALQLYRRYVGYRKIDDEEKQKLTKIGVDPATT